MQGSATDIVNIFLVSSVVVLIMVALVAVFMVLYQRRLVGQRLDMQRREIDYQREVMHATVDSQEKERERIGRDLHDGVGAMLSAIRMHLTVVDRRLKKVTAESVDLIEAKGMLDEVIGSVRGISHDLVSPSLNTLGLEAAVPAFMDRIEKLAGISSQVAVEGVPVRLPAKKELAAFRVIQELTHNSLKHAKPMMLQCRLHFKPDRLAIMFADDGKGFDPEVVRQGAGGLGLMSMENRVRMFGGKFELDSGPGRGVQVHFTFPL